LATHQVPIIAGVFDEEVQAKNAVNALRNAAFERDQIGVAMQSSGPSVDHLNQDLMNLGVEEKRAAYYHQQCKEGHIVVSVRPDGREDVVRHILTDNGAHDYEQGPRAKMGNPERREQSQIPDQ
jgi:hypothetical protein